MENLARLKAAWKRYRNRLRAVSLALVLYLLYRAGFPPAYLPVIAAFYVLLILLREGAYAKTDELLRKKLPLLGRLPPWAGKLLVMAAFVLLYLALRQALFVLLKLAGIDLQEKVLESVNASLKKDI